jgi:hypothetical protein
MIRQSCLLGLAASLVMLAACGDDDETTTPTTSTASVRFINATNTSIGVASNGVTATGNGSLGFGASSSCVNVNVNATGSSGLTFTNATSGAAISGFAPSFTAGGNYTVVAYTDASGATQFAILNNTNTPATGMAGVRLFNAAPGSGNITLFANGSALTGATPVTFGSGGTFVSVPAGSQTITFNNGTTAVLSAGSMAFTAGQNSTIVLGPAATGTTTPLRFFTANGC